MVEDKAVIPTEAKDDKAERLEQTKAYLKELKEVNRELETEQTKHDEFMNRTKLGGKSELVVPVVKEETPKEYAKRVMSGKK